MWHWCNKNICDKSSLQSILFFMIILLLFIYFFLAVTIRKRLHAALSEWFLEDHQSITVCLCCVFTLLEDHVCRPTSVYLHDLDLFWGPWAALSILLMTNLFLQQLYAHLCLWMIDQSETKGTLDGLQSWCTFSSCFSAQASYTYCMFI